MKKTAIVFSLLFSTLGLSQEETKLDAATFKGLAFRGIGPALMSGRVADIAIHPKNQSIWYVAVGSGGVWKTVNAGTTWTPLTDGEPSYSMGCVTVDPNNPETIWVGTGENVSGRHVGFGDGVYRSLNGGKTWDNMGLGTSEHIGKILVDPRNSDVVYVAAEGPLWAPGGERGVFKTTDGGKTWNQVLAISENTGVTDLGLDPRNPDVLFAAAYQRRRHIYSLLSGGPESGIYKTTNAGEDWRRLTSGLPSKDMGRIGLAVSPVNPDVVYATIEALRDERGFYRSGNSGESWEKRSDYISGATGPHYYQEIYASPHKLDRIYQMDATLRFTDDGGKTFVPLGETYKHGDNHAMAFDPNDPNYLIVGCDGGIYESFDHGKSWKFAANLPVTQFYKLALDNDTPFYNIVGGTQDNNTQVGPSRTGNLQGIQNSDWYNTVGGDGYACQIDPEDPNIIYSEWQYGGLMRFDRTNGELVDIKPQPRKGDPPERWNWDAPILISPHSHTRLYFSSQRLWRSNDRGDSWTPISPDLSRGRNRYELPLMGRVWSVDDLYDNGAMSWYANTTTISESPVQEGLIYVGTDDGLIQVTDDGGANWRRIDRFTGVPERSFVNKIKASLHDADTVFAVFDNHKVGDFKPYLVKSNDRGRTWTSIVGDIPDRHLVWSIVEDHEKPELLFVGTEFGIFFTVDGGAHWIKLEGGVPTIAFRDLEIQRRENDLVGASFGRGFYILDDYTPLRHMTPDSLSEDILFPVRKSLLYVPSIPLGLREKANLGGSHYTAPNPPFGAVFTYYLQQSLKTEKELRREKEDEIRKEGEDTPFPGWEALEKELREDKPAVVFTIEDTNGNVIRRITGPTSEGFHRVAWDLRYPPFTPTVVDKREPESLWETLPVGPLVTPGSYTVSMAKWVNGELETLGASQTVEVEASTAYALSPQDRSQTLAFQQQAGELQRKALAAEAVLEDAMVRISFIKQAVIETPKASPDLMKQARSIELGLKDVEKKLVGDPVRGRLSEPSDLSVLGLVNVVTEGTFGTTYGPTGTHRQSFEHAAEMFEEIRVELTRLVETELQALEEQLETAGAPYTPGRKPRE